MFDALIKLVIGDLDEKRAYRRMMKRVTALPKEYRVSFRKMQRYLYTVGAQGGDIAVFTDLKMFLDLLDLFETSAAEHRRVLDVVGRDVGAFCDGLVRASSNPDIQRENINKEVRKQ